MIRENHVKFKFKCSFMKFDGNIATLRLLAAFTPQQ